ncbi:hypothetical protein D9615_009545 [Tricholomella constricta]|uniref:SH3 domain-containing protein n=1 Tax=Tricholomella constricta TaxID=117010 RepID=A0A8H5GVL0_9AGAR|nr:hypothetical protein D9615_009545 [Tricholomella constricta]
MSDAYVPHTFGITILVRDPNKAKVYRTLGVKAVVGSNSDTALLQQLAADAEIVFACADADDLDAAKAILAGLKDRFDKTGTPPSLIHTSGTGVLVDDAGGMHSTPNIYSDLDIEKLESLPPTQPHRNVDLTLVEADNQGYVKTYVVLPGTIYGLATGPLVDLGLQNSHSQQIPALVKIAVGLVIWLLIRVQRKRAAAKREEIRGAAFLSVRGLVKEGAQTESEKGGVNYGLQPQSFGFSRERIDSSVVLPDKVLQSPPKLHTSSDVMNYHRQSGTFPKPFSFALSVGAPTGNRQSFMTHQSRFSVVSTSSSVDSNPTSGTARKVRQLFDPVLPDELLLMHLGEQLTLVQSFDDGWCLVGRESSTLVASAKSLFKPNVAPENDVELGVVPAWCFIRSAPGLRAERPIRSTSLGITVQLNAPGFSSRDNVISWSNF